MAIIMPIGLPLSPALLFAIFHDGIVSCVYFGHLAAVLRTVADVRMIQLGETNP